MAVKHRSVNVLLRPIAARLSVSAIFPIHETDDIFAVQKAASTNCRNFKYYFLYGTDLLNRLRMTRTGPGCQCHTSDNARHIWIMF